MKTYAFYDDDGNITKVISTTRNDIVLRNADGLRYVKVDRSVKTTTHEMIDGVATKLDKKKKKRK